MSNSQFFSNCPAESILEAAAALKAGCLVAFPTETVYGLGADASNEIAVKRIYEVKGRPTNHPLIIHVSSINALDIWAKEIPDYAIELAHVYWPGPMTIILKRSSAAKDFVTGGEDSVGIRIPSNLIALKLLSDFESLGGLGVAAPSANRFGQVSPTSSSDVSDEIGSCLLNSDVILNGGQSEVGIESTIIDCRSKAPTILRPGAITESLINKIRRVEFNSHQNKIRVSGSFEKHYAPAARILVNQTPIQGQAYYALSKYITPENVYRISAPISVENFAKDLYKAMREADKLGFTELVIQIPDNSELAVAIGDRVLRSAKGR